MDWTLLRASASVVPSIGISPGAQIAPSEACGHLQGWSIPMLHLQLSQLEMKWKTWHLVLHLSFSQMPYVEVIIVHMLLLYHYIHPYVNAKAFHMKLTLSLPSGCCSARDYCEGWSKHLCATGFLCGLKEYSRRHLECQMKLSMSIFQTTEWMLPNAKILLDTVMLSGIPEGSNKEKVMEALPVKYKSFITQVSISPKRLSDIFVYMFDLLFDNCWFKFQMELHIDKGIAVVTLSGREESDQLSQVDVHSAIGQPMLISPYN